MPIGTMLKRILIAVSTGLILLAITGCGKPSDSQGKTKITVTTWDSADNKVTREMLLKAFEKKHPEIVVEWIDITAPQYYAKLQTMIAGDAVPDAAFMAYDVIPSFAANGALQCLDSYLAADTSFNLNDYYPKVREMLSYNGKPYAVARDFTVFALYYNKDMFDKAGVSYPDESWDWGKFREACLKLTKDTNGDGKVDQYAFVNEPWMDSYIWWIWENGGDIVDNNCSKSVINTPQAIEALKYLGDLRNKDKVMPRAVGYNESGQENQSMLVNGKLGMYVNGSWLIGLLSKQAKYNWDVAPVPRGPKNRQTVLFTVGMVIPAKSKHPKEAWEFLKFVGGPEGQSFYGSAEIGSGIPAIRSIAESTVFMNPKYKPQHRHVLLEAAEKYASPLMNCQESNDIQNSMNRWMDYLWTGQKPTEEVCRIVDKEINKIFKESKKVKK
jgi:multiple sugar transport system substrate-binding protein